MTRDEMLDKREDVLDEFDDRVDPSHGVMTLAETRWFTAQLLSDEVVRLRDRLAAVEAERDALKPLGEVLMRYFNMEASEDAVYRTFCEWRTAVGTVTAAEQEVANGHV